MLRFGLFGVLPALAVVLDAQSPPPRPPVPGAPAGVTAFVGVAVVPMDTERVLPNQTVLVEGGRITRLGPASDVRAPTGAVQIDGTGKYLIPGLSDMHVHVGTDESALKPFPYDSAAAERRLFLWLANGITTVRNLDYKSAEEVAKEGAGWTQLDPTFVLRLRARATAGTLLSPRIYTSGPWGPDHYNGVGALGGMAVVPPLDSVAAYVAAYKAAGYDFIKIHDEESAELLDSLATAARRSGIPIVGHAWGSGTHFHSSWAARATAEQTLAWVAKAGFASVEHRTGFAVSPDDTARLRALAAETRRAGVWHCPTLVTGSGPAAVALVKAFHEAGVGLLLGTDAPLFPHKHNRQPHGDPGVVHLELQALVAAGLTPYQALLTGTRNVAQYFGTLAETGTIAAGKRADLVLLTGNPLADIRNTQQPAGVMLGGRWLSREAIEHDPHVRVERWLEHYRQYANRAVDTLIAALGGTTAFTVASRKAFRAGVYGHPEHAARSAIVYTLTRGADTAAVRQQLLDTIARQFGEHRARLSAEQQALFDPHASAWVQQYTTPGHRPAIPGVQP